MSTESHASGVMPVNALRDFEDPDVTLFNASPLPTLLLDTEFHRVLAANEAAQERYGYSSETILATRLADLVAESDAPRPIAQRKLETGARVTVERQTHRRRDGTLFPVHCASREFSIGHKRFVLMVVTELSELRVLDAEDRFIEKIEGMRRLGGGIAHEFNNLITAIIATADMALVSAGVDASLRADLESIRDAGRRAAAKTRQLMAFSGSQVMSLRETDVNALLEQLTPLVRHLLPDGIDLGLHLAASAHVRIDPARFEQAMLNLVLNAVDAMPAGGRLSIDTMDSGAFALIVVSDTGAGMEELTLARLFEPFHSTKGPSGGRGLGLASVWGTVRQMQGSIDIESATSRGTSVRMFFPKVLAPTALEFISAPVASSAPGGEIILVVEDEPSVRAPICRKLRMEGYLVLEADNGSHALEVIGRHPALVHLVITDVMMPEMDGAQLVAQLRGWYPATRVLFMSGYSPQYLAAQGGSKVEGSDFLAKPFTLNELSNRVRGILDAEWSAPGTT